MIFRAREMSETTCWRLSLLRLAAGGGHKLEVVYDYQAQIIHPAALGVHVGHREGRVVVNQNIGPVEVPRRLAAVLPQSSSESLPVTSFLLSTKLSPEMRRMASCSRLISRRRRPPPCPEFARVGRTFRAKEVLPMPGRAARRSRSGLVEARDGPVHVGQAGGEAGDIGILGGQLVEPVVHA